MNSHTVEAWAKDRPFDPLQIDCATSLMLKILDGKCKMNAEEKQVMAVIYDVVKHQPGKLLDPSIHQLITTARNESNEQLIAEVYEQRLYAEQMISRPVMKAYKAMLRQAGILG
jgi:hypothetical protein